MNDHIETFANRLLGIINNPCAQWDFAELALELFRLQHAQVAPYRKLCESRRIDPHTIQSWTDIPCFPAAGFKDFEVTSLAPETRTGWFLSSGTTAKHSSRHFHNDLSLRVYASSLSQWFEMQVLQRHAISSSGNASHRLISLSPPRHAVPHSSLVFMFDAWRSFFDDPAFLGSMNAAGEWTLDCELAVHTLQTNMDRPVFLAGTAFLYVMLLDWMEANGVSLRLPKGSLLLETGGYKGRVRHVSKAVLYKKMQCFFGIPQDSILCEYGMCELGSQAYDEPASKSAIFEETRLFQFPPWVRARIISPETGREVQIGETGLICIFDLANIHSVMAIQTEDVGIRRTNGFNLLGRDWGSEPKGCSMMAAEQA